MPTPVAQRLAGLWNVRFRPVYRQEHILWTQRCRVGTGFVRPASLVITDSPMTLKSIGLAQQNVTAVTPSRRSLRQQGGHVVVVVFGPAAQPAVGRIQRDEALAERGCSARGRSPAARCATGSRCRPSRPRRRQRFPRGRQLAARRAASARSRTRTLAIHAVPSTARYTSAGRL